MANRRQSSRTTASARKKGGGNKGATSTPSSNSTKNGKGKKSPTGSHSTSARKKKGKVQSQLVTTVRKRSPSENSQATDKKEASETSENKGKRSPRNEEASGKKGNLDDVKENLFDKGGDSNNGSSEEESDKDEENVETKKDESKERPKEGSKDNPVELEDKSKETINEGSKDNPAESNEKSKESFEEGSKNNPVDFSGEDRKDPPEDTNGTDTDRKRERQAGTANEHSASNADEEDNEILYYNKLTNSPPTKFKKVDCYSVNRKECVRVRHSRERSSTPEKSNRLKFQNEYYSRVTVKVTIAPSAKPHEAVCAVMQEFFKEIFQADEKAQILPWKSLSSSNVLNAQSELPQTITGMTKYCFRVYTPKEGVPATIYPQLFIGHDCDFDDLRESLQPWLDAKLFGIYLNMLQAEDAKDIGWLLYSTREMDTGALADEIMDIIGCKIGLRWKNIQNGTKTTKDNLVKALIVEASAKEKFKVQRELINLYSRSIKPPRAYPNSIRLRYVKFKKDAVNKEEKSKINKLRHRQKQFLEGIKNYITSDILQLDYSSDPGNEPTLRQMILELKHSESGNPLFHTVDMDWRQDGFVFQYSIANAEEAETNIHTLLTILEHHYPDIDIAENFSEEAIENNMHMYWDEERQCAVDSKNNETSEFQADEELPGFIFDKGVLNELNKGAERTAMPDDSDSISTFRQGRRGDSVATIHGNLSPVSGISSARPASSSASVVTSLTNETYASLDSRISGLASQMQSNQAKTEKQIQKQQQQFEQILQSLQTISKERSTSSKEASSPETGKAP